MLATLLLIYVAMTTGSTPGLLLIAPALIVDVLAILAVTMVFDTWITAGTTEPDVDDDWEEP